MDTIRSGYKDGINNRLENQVEVLHETEQDKYGKTVSLIYEVTNIIIEWPLTNEHIPKHKEHAQIF